MKTHCACFTWARTDIQCKDGKELPHPMHAPRCPHFNESLIDVWRFSFDGDSYVTKNKPTPQEIDEAELGGIVITKEQMHLEVFEALVEHNGF